MPIVIYAKATTLFQMTQSVKKSHSPANFRAEAVAKIEAIA
ncbi:protein of unknown function [Pseudorhizobium banfieldiae]|uniref:Uncharacterized protein n=1 Tax=Pseudorhizobium banfieldiae TaxID=1125847 RepID=L0NCS6_9HYPH|nr:protein of unknown function [Pseudorhizobium banfieldiae]